MKQTVIGLLSLPPIIESGITSMIGKMRSVNCSIHRIDPARIKEQAAHLRPTVVIADPFAVGPSTAAELRASSKNGTKLVGINYCAIPPASARLFDAIVSVHDQASAVESILNKLSAFEDQASEDVESKSLSQREKDVVIGIAKGLSNKEIAARMSVSVNTVMTHRRNISANLKIHSPAGITIYAIVSKLIKLEDIKTDLG